MQLNEIDKNNIKILDSTPPEGSSVVNSLTMEATVDVNPQPLKTLLPFIQACQKIPADLPAEAAIVLQALFSCFEKQKNVKEGLLGDVFFGFEACHIPSMCTYTGLKQLWKEGYIKFQAKDNSYVELESDLATGAFIRYQKKLLDLIYE